MRTSCFTSSRARWNEQGHCDRKYTVRQSLNSVSAPTREYLAWRCLAEIEHLFFAERPQVHALVLLRRRLRGLFGRLFQLEVRSEIGEGTTVTLRIPLQKHFGVNLKAPRAVTPELGKLALE